MNKLLISSIAVLVLAFSASAQESKPVRNYGLEADYDEMTIPPYVIPDVLEMTDGTQVTNVGQWEKRRAEILDMLQKEMYGYMPEHPKDLHFKVGNVDEAAIGGKATRKEVKVFMNADESISFTMLMYVPNGRKSPVPAFLGLNFCGNHTICDDPGISIYDTLKVVTRFGDPHERGYVSSRWPVDMIMDSGYALATIFYEEMTPDVPDHATDGIHPFGEDWGTICAWAWGLSCAMDYLVTDPALDPGKIAVIGHSRLGKTSLWAAAMDKRFAMAISSCSGCCGAAFSRRMMGETLAAIRDVIPHWFIPGFCKYGDNEEALPFDQHFLIAAIAPRPVYIGSATQDIWADPHGEFLSGRMASPVFALYGEKGLVTDPVRTEPVPAGYVPVSGYVTDEDNEGTTNGPARDGGNVISDAILLKGYPKADTPLQDGLVGYHVRSGFHDITYWDWQQYIAFADKRMK